MSCRKKYEAEREINDRYEQSMKAMLSGDLYAYRMMTDALNFAKERRKGVENDTGIQDLHRLEES
jgi:hypothetical protein